MLLHSVIQWTSNPMTRSYALSKDKGITLYNIPRDKLVDVYFAVSVAFKGCKISIHRSGGSE